MVCIIIRSIKVICVNICNTLFSRGSNIHVSVLGSTYKLFAAREMSKDRRFDSRCKAIKRVKDSSWAPRDRFLFQVVAKLPPSCPLISYFSKFTSTYAGSFESVCCDANFWRFFQFVVRIYLSLFSRSWPHHCLVVVK